MKNLNNLKSHSASVYSILEELYPTSKIMLNYGNPPELLISVMLSAQCTDKRVNIVTKELFQKYKTAADYADADIDEIKRIIHSAGFFNAKAKHIQESCKLIVENFQGKVPDTMEDLLSLPGVARKTANIVLSNAFGINDGIAVDTHVKRLSFRLGLTKNTDPNKVEQDLMKLYPRDKWNKITYLLIEHGRKVCKAQRPICKECKIKELCLRKSVK
ncbi:MAG: endonuclease III [archaeon]